MYGPSTSIQGFLSRPFSSKVSTILRGAIKASDYQNGTVAAVGGGELKLYTLDYSTTIAGSAAHALYRFSNAMMSPHALLEKFLLGKCLNSMCFTNHNSMDFSSALLQVHPWKLLKAAQSCQCQSQGVSILFD